MPTSTTCETSSVPRAATSRRSAASAIGSPMPDGVPAPNTTTAAADQVTPDEARLLRRVRYQLTLWSGGITLGLLLALGAVLYLAVDRSLSSSGTAELVAQANAITGQRPDPNTDLPSGGFVLGGPGSGLFTMVLDEQGQQIGPGPRVPGLPVKASVDAVRADGARDIREASIEVSTQTVGGGGVQVRSGGTPVRVLTDPVQFRGRQLYVQIVGDRTSEERTLRVLVLVLIVGGAIALLIASGVGAAYATRALVPIRTSLINQREALRRQREFAADASHELRTPLTVIRASVDDLQRHPTEPVGSVGSALTDIRDEVDHLTGMVEDLLLLARSDSGAVALERVPV